MAIKTAATQDNTLQVARNAGLSAEGGALCECGCPEAQHEDADYDHDGERYVRCPQPCLNCNCEDFWREE